MCPVETWYDIRNARTYRLRVQDVVGMPAGGAVTRVMLCIHWR